MYFRAKCDNAMINSDNDTDLILNYLIYTKKVKNKLLIFIKIAGTKLLKKVLLTFLLFFMLTQNKLKRLFNWLYQ